MFFSSVFSLILATSFQAASAGPLACNDERLQTIFKTERERDVSKLCELADKSRYGQIEVKNDSGQMKSISCCRNDYELMQVSAELHVQEKNKFCTEVQNEASNLNCGTNEECIEEKFKLSKKADEKIAALREKLASCRKIGSQCKAVINAATSKIQSELLGLQRLRNAATSEAARKQIDAAVTIGGQ